MRNLTCIVCPIGCPLDVNDNRDFTVTGNKCPRGEVYALEEIRAPKRVVTATMQILENQTDIESSAAGSGKTNSIKRAPVKTSSPCLRENINELLADIYAANVRLPVKTGDVIIAGWKPKNNNLCEGIDIISTRTID